MAAEVIKLVTSKDKVVRACSTCRHRYKEMGMYRCGAVERFCAVARLTECNSGELWELKEPTVPIFAKIRKWWLGW